jgi:hypothetical protein
VGPRCHRDDEKFGAVPNSFPNLRSTMKLLYVGAARICNSGAVFRSGSSPKHLKYAISYGWRTIIFCQGNVCCISREAENISTSDRTRERIRPSKNVKNSTRHKFNHEMVYAIANMRWKTAGLEIQHENEWNHPNK